MRDTELSQFAKLLGTVFSYYDKAMSNEMIKVYFDDLKTVDFEIVKAAFSAHRKDPERGQFLPKVSDVVAQIRKAIENDGRPAPDEAWAIALDSQNEANTVFMTDEIASAWGIARPAIDAKQGGGRLAFIEAYKRLVSASRASGVAVRWFASYGTDRGHRALAVQSAIDRGLIAGDRGTAMLSQVEVPALPAPTHGDEKAYEEFKKFVARLTEKRKISEAEMEEKHAKNLDSLREKASISVNAMADAARILKSNQPTRQREVRHE